MAGKPGTGGRIPKRSSEVRRRNKPQAGKEITPAPSVLPTIPIPEADPKWHPLAKQWYESLRVSGQCVFFQPSDWALAQICANELTTYLKNKTPAFRNGTVYGHIMSAMAALGTSEGDRRRLRIEIDRPDSEEKPSVAAIDAYRKAAGA